MKFGAHTLYAGSNGQTDTQTHTHKHRLTDYSCACAPSVNERTIHSMQSRAIESEEYGDDFKAERSIEAIRFMHIARPYRRRATMERQKIER